MSGGHVVREIRLGALRKRFTMGHKGGNYLRCKMEPLKIDHPGAGDKHWAQK